MQICSHTHKTEGFKNHKYLLKYLDMPPSPLMTSGDIITDKSLAGNIVFKNVKFSYPTRPDHVVLKNFNLHIPAGKTVAIVGASGNGKSTVAALLERYNLTIIYILLEIHTERYIKYVKMYKIIIDFTMLKRAQLLLTVVI